MVWASKILGFGESDLNDVLVRYLAFGMAKNRLELLKNDASLGLIPKVAKTSDFIQAK